jgi:hypothetical protein
MGEAKQRRAAVAVGLTDPGPSSPRPTRDRNYKVRRYLGGEIQICVRGQWRTVDARSDLYKQLHKRLGNAGFAEFDVVTEK